MTRLPPPSRRTAGAVARLLAQNLPYSVFLEPDRAAASLTRLPAAGRAGGAVYGALVGAAGVPLVSRDRRALGTYRALEVDVVLVG